MSYADPSLQMQKAIVAWLNANTTGPMVGGRIYDGVPANATKPYVSFGPFQTLPEHGDCLDGGEIFITLDAWAAGPSTVQVKQIGSAIAADLDEAALVLDAPQRLVDISIEQTQYMRDPDGLTAHAVITVHAWTEPIGEGSVDDYVMSAGRGTFVLTGYPISTGATLGFEAAAGSFALTGNDANLVVGSQNLMQAQTGVFVLTGNDATLTVGAQNVMQAGAGSFVLTGIDANLVPPAPGGDANFSTAGNPMLAVILEDI